MTAKRDCQLFPKQKQHRNYHLKCKLLTDDTKSEKKSSKAGKAVCFVWCIVTKREPFCYFVVGTETMEVYNMSSLILALKTIFSNVVIFYFIYIYLFIREDCVKLSLVYNYKV